MAIRAKRFIEVPRCIRFKKNTDKKLALFCLKNEIGISTVVQSAVECFLSHKDCYAYKQVLSECK